MGTIAALAVSSSNLCSGCRSTIAELPVRTEHVAGTDFRDWTTFRFAREQIDRIVRRVLSEFPPIGE